MKNSLLLRTCALVVALNGAMALYAADAKPEYGEWGFDIAGGDKATKPGDDFFRYASGTWIDKTEIPADKAGVSLRLAMSDRTEGRLHEMMEQAAAKASHEPSDLEGKIGAFYKAFMDESHVESRGVKPVLPQLDDVKKATTRDALAGLMGRSNTDFENSLFAFGIDVDLKDPKHYALYVGQAGLALPDRDYYLKPDFAKQKAAYETYAAKLLELASWKNPAAAAKDVVAFETKIAEASWTKAQQRDPVAVYNPMSVQDLAKLAPGFAWKEFFAQADAASIARVVIAEKTAFPKLTAVYSQTPIETIKAWHVVHILDNAAPYLSKAFADAYFEMRGKTLQGQQEQQVRWKRGVYSVSGGDFGVGDRYGTFGSLGFGVGQLYTAKYFPPESKARIEALVDNLKAAFHTRIEHLDWMGAATKQEALKKLETYTIKVGYPDHPRDYSKLVIRDDDLVGDVLRCGQADWTFAIGRFDGPVDRSDWNMSPQTNDAYNGSLRDIVFPAAILQAPMFDVNADPAINYGAIGGVIGHELTHGFDDEGRKIDADGALRDWWTADDAKTFDARAKLLGSQYSAFEPLPGVHINGDLTMGENIADMGGLTLALDAYRTSLKGKPAPVIDGLTGDQRVFLGWAQAWRGKTRDDAIRRQVVSDPHSPRKFRVNGVVRNIDAWYSTFDVKPGEKLFVAPDQRVRIW
jgi:putative endopeptidase